MSPRPRFALAVTSLTTVASAALLACASGTPAPNASPPHGDASASASGSVAAAPSTSVAPLPSIVVSATASGTASASNASPPPKVAEKGDHAFAARLYGTQHDAKGNVVISPSSARVALSMAYVGAKGKTATQMADVLGLEDDPAKVATEMSATIARWNAGGDPKVKLRIANATWGDKSVPFTETWRDAMKSRYSAPLQLVDFKGGYEPARKTINDWIGAKTEQKILGTLQPGDLDTYTRFVLVNATYFDGQWSHAFEAKGTADGAFHVAAGKDVQKKLMHQTSHLKYGETPDAQVLSMPYGSPGKSGYSMVVVLPKKTFGLSALETGMTGATIDGWLAAPSWEQEVVVTFPRIEAEARLLLGGALAKLGMLDAFDPEKSDFSGIAPHQGFADNLYIAKVIQKSWIKVDEKGTEAAAATVVIGAMPTSVAMPHVFDATHPFLYFLRDEAGNVLFMGRVVE
jgi:serpin B